MCFARSGEETSMTHTSPASSATAKCWPSYDTATALAAYGPTALKTRFSVAPSHSSTLSAEIVATTSASLDTAIARRPPVLSMHSSPTSCAACKSQNRVRPPFLLAVTSMVPSTSAAIASTSLPCRSTLPAIPPVTGSHSPTRPEEAPTASLLPPWRKASAGDGPPGPISCKPCGGHNCKRASIK